jgi:hypothetical protein
MVSFRVLLVTSLLWAGSASAEIIWDQPWDGKSGAFIAQEFSDSSNLSAFQLDDFTITRPYYIDKVTVPGFEGGLEAESAGGGKHAGAGPRLWVDAAEILDAAVTPAVNMSVKNNAVTAEIWEGLPGSFGGHKVMGSASGGEEVQSGTLVVNFGGQRLPPGQYWLSVYVSRPLHTGGQWFWLSTEKVTGSEHYFYSRGRAYGVGPDPVPASRVPYAEEQVKTDMAFTLQGRPAGGEERPSAVPQAPGALPSTTPEAGKPPSPESAAPGEPAPPAPKAPAAAPTPPAVQAQPSRAGPGATSGPPPPGQPSFPAVGPPPMRMPPMPPRRRPVAPPPEPLPVSPESRPQQPPSAPPGG